MGGVGNAIITSSYLLTGSPLAAILSHVAMHVAAVLHGMETRMDIGRPGGRRRHSP